MISFDYLLKRKLNDFDGNSNKKVNSNNPLKRKSNDFDGNSNKKVNSNNLCNENEKSNKPLKCEEIVKQKIKLLKGFYISADNKIKEKTKGTINFTVSVHLLHTMCL